MSGVSSNIATTPESHELLAHFQRQPKLMDNLRQALQARRYSKSTEHTPDSYWGYGAGLRLIECLRLRVQDIDFARNEIMVRNGKGANRSRANGS